MGVVYCATNRINGKRYVGRCRHTMQSRRSAHIRSALGGARQAFSFAIRKYGADSFVWEVLFENSRDVVLGIVEQQFIQDFGCQVPNGYNMTPGGDGGFSFVGRQHSEETRRKISVGNQGKKRSAEFKQQVSRIHKGRKRRPETVEKIRRALVGRKHTEETKAKISELSKAKRHSPETRQQMSDRLKQRSPEVRRQAALKSSQTQKGRVFTEEHRNKLSEARRRNIEKQREQVAVMAAT